MKRVTYCGDYREPSAWCKEGIGYCVKNTSELAKERKANALAIRIARARHVTAL